VRLLNHSPRVQHTASSEPCTSAGPLNRRPAVLNTWFTCVPAGTLLWRRSFSLYGRRRVLRWAAAVEAPHQLRPYPTSDGVLAALRGRCDRLSQVCRTCDTQGEENARKETPFA
jgi:hypothetical protein